MITSYKAIRPAVSVVRLFVLSVLVVLGTSCATRTDHDHEEDEHGHEHAHGGEATEVEVTRAQMDAVGIILGGMEKRDMADVVSATGVLAVNARDEGVVTARLSGTVTSLRVVQGQKVKAGQIVASVESPQLLQLRQELRLAVQDEETALVEFQRQEALAAGGAGVRKNLDNARAALGAARIRVQNIENQLRSFGVSPSVADQSAVLSVAAPISGTVVAVDATVGSYADPQLPIARVVNNDAIYCQLQLLEKDISKVKVGMEVTMRLTNSPDEVFSGKVREVSSVLDPATRTVAVMVGIDRGSAAGMLIPGMAVTAQINLGGTPVDALPEGAVVSAGGKYYIFVLEDSHEEDGHTTLHFDKVEVVRGITSFGYVAVTPVESLEPDARIVVSGAFYLNSMSSDHGEHNH